MATPEEIEKAKEWQREAQRNNREKQVKWLKGLSDDALREENMKDHTGELGRLVEIEVECRAARQSPIHWTVTPGFIVLVLTMVFAAIAAWPVIRDWIWP